MKENGKKNLLPNQSQKSDQRRLPAYIEGAASVADLYGMLFIDFMGKFNINDDQALRSDWESVGQDMKNVISQAQILRLVELQSEHRRTGETKSLDASIAITKRGQLLAFLLSLAGFSTAILCAYLNQPVPSTVIGGGTLIGLAALFIKGYTHKRCEENDVDAKEQAANIAP